MNSEWNKLIGKRVRVVWHDGYDCVGVLEAVDGKHVTLRTGRGGTINGQIISCERETDE